MKSKKNFLRINIRKRIFLVFLTTFIVINSASSFAFHLDTNFSSSICTTKKDIAIDLKVLDEANNIWKERIVKPAGTDLLFKIEITDVQALLLGVVVGFPDMFEYTGSADPQPSTPQERVLAWKFLNVDETHIKIKFRLKIVKLGTADVYTSAVTTSDEPVFDSVNITADNYAPVADADGSYSGKVETEINFDGSGSYDPDGTILFYEWDFGDGHTGNGEKTTHKYESKGTYTVTLVVEDNDGAMDTDITTTNIKGNGKSINKNPGDIRTLLLENKFFDLFSLIFNRGGG